MATHHPQLARLNIPQGSSPVPQPLYTPGLPTAIQQSFNMNMSMGTPLQSNFGPQVPPHPNPRHGMHRAHPSLMFPGPAAALAAAGIAPPSGMPITPVGISPHVMLGGPGFQRGSKRAPSISTGGPPKAPLGGPNRKHSPAPTGPTTSSISTQAVTDKAKAKKVAVKLPVETVVENGDERDDKVAYSLWGRRPLPHAAAPSMHYVKFPEITTMETHPIEQSTGLPPTLDVFLPGKSAWDDYKQNVIEEKLQRLGVERGGNSAPPGQSHIHGRAASISSPADPALLLFKLNKLQQSQNGSASVSPQPPSTSMSVSPNPPIPPRFQNPGSRHGQSFSLANFNATQLPQFHNTTAAFNPFGPSATLGSDQIFGQRVSPNPFGLDRDPPPHLHAPQGVVPVSLNMQAESATASTGPSRVASTIPDFNRGFGLDIPEEDEEEVEAFGRAADIVTGGLPMGGEDDDLNEVEDDVTTAAAHSRHVSKVSIALSLKSMGGRSGNTNFDHETSVIEENAPPELEKPVQWDLNSATSLTRNEIDHREAETDADPVGEWTGSEDNAELEEFSNPSDEERALNERQARREARARRESYQDQETPRRLPDFPRPPEGPTFVHHVPSAADEDIVSNPSEEGMVQGHNGWLHPDSHQQVAYYQPIVDGQPRSPRPLPPLPHSRTASGNYSHPSSMLHSRNASAKINDFEPSARQNPSNVPIVRRELLNPFAKPFVFGGGGLSGDSLGNVSQPDGAHTGHIRQQSSGRVLNAAAAEFKPTGFTFRPPAGVPTLSFAGVEPSRPLPQVPLGISPSRVQGREKRQRRNSSIGDDEDVEENAGGRDVMISFRFPPSSPPAALHAASPAPLARAISPMPQRKSQLNAAAPPFTFSGATSLALPFAAKEPPTLPYPLVPGRSANKSPASVPVMQTQSEPDAHPPPVIEGDMKEAVSETAASALPSPSPARKRPPVLDFKHPVSTNTVPAALFRKALIGTDMEGSTRPSVRSRLSSREIFDHLNSPSLDDTNVPTISRKSNVPHPRITAALQDEDGRLKDQPVDIFTPVANGDRVAQEKRLQVPTSAVASPVSESMLSYTRRQDEVDQIDQRLEDLLDDRMEDVKKDLVAAQAQATERVVDQVISAIKDHISDLVPRPLAENVMDARGEVDFELIRNTLEQGVMDIRTGLRRDLEEVLRSVELAHVSRERSASGLPEDFQRIMEDFGGRTVGAVTNAVVKFATRIDQIDELARVRAADDRDQLLGDFFKVLAPHLDTLRQPPIDFDLVTAKLAEAVKPHISQLIDLTSDKKETAGLIVQRLMPTLSALSQTPANVDTDAIVSHLRVEIARMVPSADPHVLKEAVADLVVERLDSRLAVREKSTFSDQLYSRISERIDDLHVPVSDVRKAVEDLRMDQESIREQGATLNTLHQDMAAQLLTLPNAIERATAAINEAKDNWTSLRDSDNSSEGLTEVLPHLQSIDTTVRSLATTQEYLASQSASLISLQESLKSQVSSLPHNLAQAIELLKQAQADFLSRSRTPDQSGEVRSLLTSNAELQVQLAKARGAHGQIRVEKDLMCDRMTAAEAERDSLRAQLDDLKSKTTAKETEVTAAGLRITELEDALSHALARLQSSDVTTQAKEERITVLERQNREFALEQHKLQSQIQKLELQSEWLSRDKDTLEQRFSQLQKDRDSLASQQTHWEELRRTSEQVEHLTRLIGTADSEELAELKRARDRGKILEGEHASLQKRFKEQEAKIMNLERASQTARQSMAQTQQRASEWEKRTKELEAELDATRARLDDADETKLQLESDLSLVKMHLEDKEAAEKVAKERETASYTEVSSLKAQITTLQKDLEKAKQIRPPLVVPSSSASLRINGYTNGQNPRPSSRASTVYGGGSPVTPTDVAYRSNKYSSHASSAAPESPKGVWGSMHAPPPAVQHASSTPPYPPRSAIPSPTPSTVSLAPTQGDDGWWS